MKEPDTIKLMRECDSGIKMGINSIDEMIEYISDNAMKDCLIESKNENLKIQEELQTLLEQYGDEGKEPNPIAKGMSWMKTNVKLTINESDQTIADLITDGCNMGIKSLNKYLNQYKAADEKSKDITQRLIKLEEKLIENMKQFL